MKRRIDLLVVSDLHLGTYGCRAKELNAYLRSIRPRQVVLNGDIIDIWQFRKSYFPPEHMKVVKRLLKWSARIPVYYVTGNHDEALRRYSPMRVGHLRLVDKLVLDLDGIPHWFIHGDIFDATMKNAKWLAKLGGFGYDLLIRINHLVNAVLLFFGRPRMSFSKKVKDSVKGAVKFISDFETTMADIALHEGHAAVVCGHIHKPRMGTIATARGTVQYLNSGDWIENMSALEYHEGKWSLYVHPEPAIKPQAARQSAKPVAARPELDPVARG
ncbi:MAG: UDP-2,3-diacylglucosamine diphosphatase [Bacteroidetes bacterium]|nr:UDP-2,3-diacylglucosamine diphosphatase [Bacteroidota bacterium]